MKKLPLSPGYSLLELLILIVILGIVSGYGLSNWSSWLTAHKHRVQITTYHNAFAFARWKAASQRTISVICPLSDAGDCVDDWSLPVSVFADSNRDLAPDDGEVWRVFPAPSSRVRVSSRTAGTGYIRFSPSGTVHGRTGSLVICSGDTKMSYLAINKGGRLRVENDKDGDGKIKLAWGGEVFC